MALTRTAPPPDAVPAPAASSRLDVRRSQPTATTPQLSVVVVNYRQWEDTERLVRQLAAGPFLDDGRAELVVVDNHSGAHAAVGLLRRQPGVALRRWGRNRGFARAVNEGCWLSRGRWVLLLNPDVRVGEGFLEEVFARLARLTEAEPRAGIVGFPLRNPDGSRQLSSGPFPTFLGTLARLALPRSRRKYQRRSVRRPTRVPWVTGCCLLVNRDCLHELGGLDEDFFLYYEDVDLCRRAAARGWSVWLQPGPRVVHERPLHARAVPSHLRLVTRHALLTYARKHWVGWQFQVLTRIVEVEAWLRGAITREATAQGHFRELAELAREMKWGRPLDARRRLDRVVRSEERRRAS